MLDVAEYKERLTININIRKCEDNINFYTYLLDVAEQI